MQVTNLYVLYYSIYTNSIHSTRMWEEDIKHINQYGRFTFSAFLLHKPGHIVKRQNMCFLYVYDGLEANTVAKNLNSYLPRINREAFLSTITNIRIQYPELFI